MKDYTQGRTPDMLEPFFPNEIFRYVIVSCFLFIVECVAVVFLPIPFSPFEKPNSVPWFGLPFYALYEYLQNDVLLIFIIVFCALFLVSWPFLEKTLRYNLKHRLSLKRIPPSELKNALEQTGSITA